VSQSRRGSLLEATANVVIGFAVAFCAQVAVFPILGWHPPVSTNLAIGGIFTVVSLVRSYVLRRLFNRVRAGWFA
jgi:hypothetical protein